MRTGFVVLSSGRYEWGVMVEEVVRRRRVVVVGKRERAATGERVLEDEGRRVWFGERPCTVVAVDVGDDGDGEEGEEVDRC